MLTRRSFLQAAAASAFVPRAVAADAKFDPQSWTSVRAQFALDPHATNLTTFLLAPHSRPVHEESLATPAHSTAMRSATSIVRKTPALPSGACGSQRRGISGSTPTRSLSPTTPRWASRSSTAA